MKVLAINGSPRKQGNTARLLQEVAQTLENHGVACEILHLADHPVTGCRGCRQCGVHKDGHCVFTQDAFHEVFARMEAADGLLLGSPVYFSNVTSEMLALIHRAGMVARVNGDRFRRKPGAAVIAVRRAGAIHAFNSINHFFLVGQMFVVGSSYWNLGMGRVPGDVEKDLEGMETMQILGQNMAWLLKRLHGEGIEPAGPMEPS